VVNYTCIKCNYPTYHKSVYDTPLNLKNKNEHIEKELVEIKNNLSKKVITNIKHGNINNGTINNTIQIVAHGKEDLSKIKEVCFTTS
jgi:hypothetical protein